MRFTRPAALQVMLPPPSSSNHGCPRAVKDWGNWSPSEGGWARYVARFQSFLHVLRWRFLGGGCGAARPATTWLRIPVPMEGSGRSAPVLSRFSCHGGAVPPLWVGFYLVWCSKNKKTKRVGFPPGRCSRTTSQLHRFPLGVQSKPKERGFRPPVSSCVRGANRRTAVRTPPVKRRNEGVGRLLPPRRAFVIHPSMRRFREEPSLSLRHSFTEKHLLPWASCSQSHRTHPTRWGVSPSRLPTQNHLALKPPPGLGLGAFRLSETPPHPERRVQGRDPHHIPTALLLDRERGEREDGG